jgi:hypothetical protein
MVSSLSPWARAVTEYLTSTFWILIFVRQAPYAHGVVDGTQTKMFHLAPESILVKTDGAALKIVLSGLMI